MQKYKGLPIYELTLSPRSEGMYTISLVDLPAVEVKWMAFEKQEPDENKEMKFSIVGEEQRMILGCVIRADFPIYRQDPNGEEYYIIFKADEIKKISQRFLHKGYQGMVNLMHDENAYVDGVNMEQLFIKDTANGISPKGFEEVEDGSLFASYKVENDEVWGAIKQGIFRGFSLEGFFKPVSAEPEIKSLSDLLNYLK